MLAVNEIDTDFIPSSLRCSGGSLHRGWKMGRETY